MSATSYSRFLNGRRNNLLFGRPTPSVSLKCDVQAVAGNMPGSSEKEGRRTRTPPPPPSSHPLSGQPHADMSSRPARDAPRKTTIARGAGRNFSIINLARRLPNSVNRNRPNSKKRSAMKSGWSVCLPPRRRAAVDHRGSLSLCTRNEMMHAHVLHSMVH